MSEESFRGTGAVRCGRCKGTGVCSTCNGDGTRKPTPGYLAQRQTAGKGNPGSNAGVVYMWYLAGWPENWMPCNGCENQSGVCTGCKGSGWIVIKPDPFSRDRDRTEES